MIPVTKTYLPDINKYKKYVDEIYQSGWVTNNGKFVRELEERLSEYLGVENLVLVANGTLALEIAYRVLEIENFAITSPFSFVATVSSLVVNKISPVFVDINPKTLLINENEIEKNFNKEISAIVPVHVFGNVCNVEKIDMIAKKYNLKVVYDAAHCFGIKYKNESILKYGDISILSFHATKVFHTIEGGALIVNNKELVEKVRYMINFGIKNEEEIASLGINAKMNEFEAAMGLCMLDEIDYIFEKREEVWYRYYNSLKNYCEFPQRNIYATNNYGYFPVIFKSETELKKIKKALNEADIFPRRYFYPSLDSLSYIKNQYMPISRDIGKRVLCLPLYPELDKNNQEKIIEIIIKEVL